MKKMQEIFSKISCKRMHQAVFTSGVL